jgi:ABC-type multidrug transport system fused ATPase/permease subunit
MSENRNGPADGIYVLSDGCVVESGTHEEQVAAEGT